MEDLKAKLTEKEAEISRVSSENDEHVKRVEELTAYIQRASQDREQIIQQYTSYSQHPLKSNLISQGKTVLHAY